ncbi:hypothetical protein ACOMICROBIO_LKFPLAJE_01856 [Vibrio sp. B1FIG11]|uniref:DUF4145 domain-containing protein n=1 Tax=Vibrio TaxID=662 RepID=UPI000682A5D8|nr:MULTISPECIES: DUF4145 domain-containing protein [Vibrio]CAE6907888.1 hypothetical protein ACOMICROBIO_LKFPLAJE_01856 [Vibrio sp. B1FIG11]
MSDKKLFCNTCKIPTNHEVVDSRDRQFEEEYEYEKGKIITTWWEHWEYSMLVCLGCDTATLETKYTNPELYDDDENRLYEYTYLPRRERQFDRTPKQFLHLDEKLARIYDEIIKSYQNGLNTVAVMGIRALLEGICVHEGIDDKIAFNLAGKLKHLEKHSSIPHQIVEGLTSIKSFGDDAAHRLVSLHEADIELSIDLLEALLTSLYEAKFELHETASRLKRRQDALKSIETE